MNLIVAVDENWGIGKENDLLYHIPEDMKFFRSMTVGKSVICGRKTLDSFPGGKPLPERKHFVLSRTESESREDVEFVRSLEDLEEKIAHIPSDEVMVIGGETVYRQLYKKCDLAYVTCIFSKDKEADSFFPDLSQEEDFELLDAGQETVSKNGLRFAFRIYKNKNVEK